MSAVTEEPPREHEARAQADHAAATEGGRHENPPLGEQLHALYAAGSGLTLALRRFFVALKDLMRAEGRVLWSGIPLLFIGFVALIALAVSLWGCAVALIGWALMIATHSIGIALGLLGAGHVVLIVGLWFMLKRGVYHVSFPQARAEARAVGAQFAEDLRRFVAGFSTRGSGPRAEEEESR